MREYMTNVLVIAMAVAFLSHFVIIAIYKRLYICENNPFILGFEIAVMVVFIIFAASNIRKLIGSKRK